MMNGSANGRNISGLRFGSLVAVKFTGVDKYLRAQWLCRCDCGVEKVVSIQHLLNERTKSCGGAYHRDGSKCHGRVGKDLSGMKFGKLTVSYRIGSGGGGPLWLCVCDCGGSVEVNSGRLVQGYKRSCGCIPHGFQKTHGQSRTKEYRRMKKVQYREASRALDSGWTSDMEAALVYFYPYCVVCGGDDRLAIDHVYPLSLGYGLCPGNATRLCKKHNSSKRDKLPEDLEDWIGDIILSSAKKFEIYWNYLVGVN